MSDPRIRRRIRIRRKLLVALYAACLAGVSIAMLVWMGPSTIPHSLEIPWLLVAGGFFAVEATALHIEVRRQTHSLSLAGFPLLLGILALNPAALVAARLVGGGLALVVVRRRSGLKLAWNLSLFAVETGVALAIARIALADGPPAGMSDWLILLAAILAAELTSLIAVPTVIMIYEGELRLTLFSQIGRSQAIAAVSSTFAIVVAGAMLHNPQLLVIAMMPLLAVAALLRIHGRLGKEHDDLQQLHGFTTAIGGRDPLDVGLRELTTILRTRGAALAVARNDGGYAVRALVDDRYTDRLMSDHILLAPPLPDDLGEAVNIDIATSDGTIASLIRQLGGQHGMGTSVLSASDERALIIVFDRLGATRNFSEDEQRLFSSLAATLSTRLSADRLLDRLELQARMDHLTRLANRSTLEHALDERLVDLARPGALVVLDLDRFKDVNDSLGHQFGDQMLRAVAERLQAMIGETDLAARLGGDEFAVLLDDIGSLEELEITVEALADRVGRPLELDGIALDLSVSIGIAAWPRDAQTSADLLRLGDIAMYEAKRTHQAWVRYVPTIDHASPNLLRLMGELRDAIQAQELVIHLQPQVRTRDLDLIGAEALVRWNHPKLGMVPPGEFLPLAEHSAVAADLTRFVLDATLDAAVRLRDLGVPIQCSVNLTSRDLLDRHLPDRVAMALAQRGLPGSALTLEVTESSLIVDIDAAIENLAALRQLGCRTSADDFGTGYASLRYLQRLPLDEVKIDRSFVAGSATNENDAAIVRSTTRLLQDLGLAVVAEGVEDLPTLNLIRDIGCDAVQGFLVSRPVPVDDFITMATERKPLVVADTVKLDLANVPTAEPS